MVFIYKVNLFSSILLMQDKYDELLMARSSGDDGVASSKPSIDSMRLWVEASGGIKRGKSIWDGILVKDIHNKGCINFIYQCGYFEKDAN